ncbi:MAG: hypothetical protein ABR953_11630 [Candidatus Acidiferrales bacterium]
MKKSHEDHHSNKAVLEVDQSSSRLTVGDRTYHWTWEWGLDPRGDKEQTRCWERIRGRSSTDVTKPARIKKLNKLLMRAFDEHEATQREKFKLANSISDGIPVAMNDSASPSEESQPKRQRVAQHSDSTPRKPSELAATGQGRNGRIWLYDAKPNQKGERYYCIFGLENNAASKCIKAEIITSRGRATQLWGEKEVSLLLRKGLRVFKKRWGRKRLKQLVEGILSPNVRGEIS